MSSASLASRVDHSASVAPAPCSVSVLSAPQHTSKVSMVLVLGSVCVCDILGHVYQLVADSSTVSCALGTSTNGTEEKLSVPYRRGLLVSCA